MKQALSGRYPENARGAVFTRPEAIQEPLLHPSNLGTRCSTSMVQFLVMHRRTNKMTLCSLHACDFAVLVVLLWLRHHPPVQIAIRF
ncbi:hypothetical protein BDW75DRAFT_209629 [Aspergillus navahoensis]